jgi:hypothetical protein
MDFNVEEEETGILGLKRSVSIPQSDLSAVNIIDQDRRRNETVTANQSNNFQKTRRHPRCASIGFAVVSRRLRQ